MGNQLLALQQMEFDNLFRIEIQIYALERARQRVAAAVFTQASALAIPYPDQFFDLVFTSGVLIHIAPADLSAVIAEINRRAKQWIWGLEYYAPQMTAVEYRGHHSLLWKTNFARLYIEQCEGLQFVREDRLRYLENANVDTAFLIRRKGSHSMRVGQSRREEA